MLSQFTIPVSVSLNLIYYDAIPSYRVSNSKLYTYLFRVKSKTKTETDDHVPAHDLDTLFFARFSCVHSVLLTECQL